MTEETRKRVEMTEETKKDETQKTKETKKDETEQTYLDRIVARALLDKQEGDLSSALEQVRTRKILSVGQLRLQEIQKELKEDGKPLLALTFGYMIRLLDEDRMQRLFDINSALQGMAYPDQYRIEIVLANKEIARLQFLLEKFEKEKCDECGTTRPVTFKQCREFVESIPCPNCLSKPKEGEAKSR